MGFPNLDRKASTSRTGSQWALIHDATCFKIQKYLKLDGRDWVFPALTADEAEAIIKFKDASFAMFKENEMLKFKLKNLQGDSLENRE